MTNFEPRNFGRKRGRKPALRRLLRGGGARLRQVPWRRLRPHTRRGAGVLLVVLMGIVWFSSGGELHAGIDTWNRRDILDAIRFVESSDREIVPDGDNGKAIGPYQIHRIYWLDATQFDQQLGGRYQDCRKRAYAERVIAAYMRRYAKTAWTVGDGQKIARIHNGGPRGHEKTATERYWQRVRQRLPAPRQSFAK